MVICYGFPVDTSAGVQSCRAGARLTQSTDTKEDMLFPACPTPTGHSATASSTKENDFMTLL